MLHLLIAAVGCSTDLYIKKKFETNQPTSSSYCNGWITTYLTYNEGAFLGIFKHNKIFLKVANTLLLIFLFTINIYLAFQPKRYFEKVFIGLITGGACSNLFDRYKKGKVTDYFMIKGIKNVVFNIGDMLIFIGSALMILKEIKMLFK